MIENKTAQEYEKSAVSMPELTKNQLKNSNAVQRIPSNGSQRTNDSDDKENNSKKMDAPDMFATPRQGSNNLEKTGVSSKEFAFIPGTLSAQSICLGESIVISNPSTKEQTNVRFKYQGKWVDLEKGYSYTISPKISQTISF